MGQSLAGELADTPGPAFADPTAATELGLGPLDGYRPDIQALRGLAVLAVVLYHAKVVFPGGFVGVDVFFVISGFVIGRVLLKRFAANSTATARRSGFSWFYVRRARRLLPALGFMLAAVILLAPLLAPLGGLPATSPTGVAAALFSANAYLFWGTGVGYFDPVAELNPLLHTWSLSVEEQFYLFLPVVLYLSWRLGKRRDRPVQSLRVFVISLIAGSFALCILLSYSGAISTQTGIRFAFFSPFTRAWEFAAGILIVVLPVRLLAPAKLRRVAIGVGLVLIIVPMLLLLSSSQIHSTAGLFAVLGTMLVIYGGTSPIQAQAGSEKGTAALAPAIWLGDLSYSWYLWHWPLIVFAAAFWPNSGSLPLLAAVGMALLLGWLSYNLIEKRFKSAHHKSLKRTVTLAACCIAAPLIAAALAPTLKHVIPDTPERLAQQRHVAERVGCDSGTPIGERKKPSCTWGNKAGGAPTIALIGDSNAGQFSEALIGAAETNGMSLKIGIHSGCPAVDLLVVTANETKAAAECLEFQNHTLRDLEADPPDVIILANSTSGYLVGSYALQSPSTGESAPVAERVQAWELAQERVLDRMLATGSRVILIAEVPKPVNWKNSATCSQLAIIIHPERCGFVDFDSRGEAPQRTAHGAETAAAGNAGAELWNFNELICPEGRCTARSSGQMVWRDDNHISIATSTALAKRSAELLRHPPE
ncbi:MAG: acyltransferase family protein [Actinobacteria bacterium]|uniref:Unannotated protein n=2 Tax=freshwater metagenome TaxID=449393 RepID=A0A6J6Y1K1_9ZZZZ|nr:acyltransferase family protein [Actinomycetota bacterium]